MIICMCRGITDRTVKQAMELGAASARDVGRMCGAGTCCGSCRSSIQAILHESDTSATTTLSALSR